jgi:acyl carrier protein
MEILTEQMLDIFEIDEIDSGVVLRELELWDSLSVISLLAVLDESYGINIEATEIADLVTVADLFTFVEQRRTK